MSRKLSEEEALQVWRQRNQEPPPYENEEELWKRAGGWLNEILQEVKNLELLQDAIDEERASVLHILVSAHAGFVRQVIVHLIERDRLLQLGAGFDAARNNKLIVPNTSMTILEIDPSLEQPLDHVRVIELLNAEHLDEVKVVDD
jgi:broad specificity phosphatase PhoE